MELTYSTENSSRITGMTYDTETNELKIDFKRGGTYIYKQVPKEVFDTLKTSPSVGKAINTLIIGGGYEYKKET